MPGLLKVKFMTKSRRDIGRIAKIYAANILRNALQGGASSSKLDLDDMMQLEAELWRIANRITLVRCSTLDDAIEKVQ